jgi:excisionase family DNA binding protein
MLKPSTRNYEGQFSRGEAEIASSLQSHDGPEWLTTEGAAEYLGISVGSVRNMTSRGQLPYRKLGRLNRYKKDELRDLLNRNRRGGSYDY